MKMDEFNRIKLKSLYNTRDLGGMPAENGTVIKEGLLYRSGRLHKIPKSTAKTLFDLGIKTIIDFRTDVERNEKPDTVIEGIKYINCPLVCTATYSCTPSSCDPVHCISVPLRVVGMRRIDARSVISQI